MREFKDKDGGKWTIDLAFGHVLRVKTASEGRFNLLEPKDLADRLANDEAEFWEVLWHLIEPQATERKIEAKQFGLAMAANCLHDARRLFFEEWRDFFLQLHRPEKAAVVEKVGEYLTKAMELVTAKLMAEGPELDAKVHAKMQATLNKGFGALLASLEPTPAPTPGGNST